MVWTNNQLLHIVHDLAGEDAMACRALFEITQIEFTEKVQTMAVSLKNKPTLFINPRFCNHHLETENDVKAVLLHEFLHVILGHTARYKLNTPLLNIATDAIINAIIHRHYGNTYSNFFNRFYREPNIGQLLRPDYESFDEQVFLNNIMEEEQFYDLHYGIYSGKICADDLHDLLKYLTEHLNNKAVYNITLLGNHNGEEEISDENKELLSRILQRMNGNGIWREPQDAMNTLTEAHAEQVQRDVLNRWRAAARPVIKKCLIAECFLSIDDYEYAIPLPVLRSGDTRAWVKFNYFSIIPISLYPKPVHRPQQKATVFLDVSGSMNEEINALITLLYQLKDYIKFPLYVFSDAVYPAVFQHHKIKYDSTGGTSIECVFNFIREHNIKKSMIVTDGYVESITSVMLTDIDVNNHHVLLSQEGSSKKLEPWQFPIHKLPKLNVHATNG
ncbi:MAG: DUF2201 family putative metallopeptidase [Chitinophagaceae bacterium]